MKLAARTCLFVCCCVLFASQTARADLIVNGGFEDPNIPFGTFSIFQSITGWDKTFGSGIEIQDHAAGSPFEGGQLVELDANFNSGMKQGVATTAGTTYELSFAFSARPGQPSNTNGISVYWNGGFLANVTASGAGLNDTDWSIVSFNVEASGNLTDLEFRATGTSDSLGGYLDRVQLEAVPIPEPSTLALFGVGVACVALARRSRNRRRS